ncbi:MAG TPA: hypothetical protein IGS53_18570 [Leptolyngbyaceae cyanobacterium M33_DOE_097]|uniref:DNA-binding protein n=1 Tax=Oscillatoriales cyanobacterium SpSt-418 TaxID=2282169 RepID=A0A7C3PCW8_9CYAN|nr:hypothetical protein [Leptolyngbyaceae cyanobacterium M33_DOE_097]
MAETTGKRTKASIVKKELVGQVAGFLGELPDKPKSELSLKEAVRELQDLIRGALGKGYTYQEVADMLSNQGIKISAFTLKSYVPAGKRQSTRAKTRRTKKEAEAATPVAVTAAKTSKAASNGRVAKSATSQNGTRPTAQRAAAKSSGTTSTRGTAKVATSKATARKTKTAAKAAPEAKTTARKAATPTRKATTTRRKKAE